MKIQEFFFFLRINVYDMNIATSIIVKISQKILGCTCVFETFKSYPHSPLYKIVKNLKNKVRLKTYS